MLSWLARSRYYLEEGNAIWMSGLRDRIKGLTDNESTKTIWFLGTTYFKSMIIVFSSMLFLLGWNMNMRFKGVISGCIMVFMPSVTTFIISDLLP